MASKAATQALQAKEKVMQDEIEKFRKLQKGQSAGEGERGGLALIRIHPPFADMQKYTASRMQLDTQLNENKTVKEVLFSGEYPPFLVYSGNSILDTLGQKIVSLMESCPISGSKCTQS